MNLFDSGFQEKKLELRLNEEVEGQVKAIGDEGKFNQVITDLLRNAFKFTHRGRVEVNYKERLQADKLLVEVEVKDTGVGIPQEKMKVIFDRFSQVDSSIRRRHEGSGLGLAITYQLVKMMEGNISVDSQPGEGSSFRVQLAFPLASKPQTVNGQAGEDFVQAFAGKKVLIVEDNAMNVMVLHKVLEQMKVESDVANNGIEALEKWREMSTTSFLWMCTCLRWMALKPPGPCASVKTMLL
ncbi:MAG: ATP-binding protein [Owenweeksia sp.]|nr:ATP-binding protein [Owenweeksia sp.]